MDTHCNDSSVNSDALNVRLADFIGRAVQGITDKINTRLQQRIDRDAFNQLLKLDTEMLNDIGVSRDDVVYASRLPISEDAAVYLSKVSGRSID